MGRCPEQSGARQPSVRGELPAATTRTKGEETKGTPTFVPQCRKQKQRGHPLVFRSVRTCPPRSLDRMIVTNLHHRGYEFPSTPIAGPECGLERREICRWKFPLIGSASKADPASAPRWPPHNPSVIVNSGCPLWAIPFGLTVGVPFGVLGCGAISRKCRSGFGLLNSRIDRVYAVWVLARVVTANRGGADSAPSTDQMAPVPVLLLCDCRTSMVRHISRLAEPVGLSIPGTP